MRQWQLALAAATAIALTALIVFGLAAMDLSIKAVWQPEGFRSLTSYACGYFGAALIYAFRWRRRFGKHLLFAALLYAAGTAGLRGVGAALLCLASALAIGDFFLSKFRGASTVSSVRLLFATLTGIGVLMFLAGVAAHFPINYPIVYIFVLAAPIAARMRPLRNVCRLLLNRMSTPRPMPLAHFGGVVLLGFVLLAHLALAVKPEVSFDALAMHLTVPAWVAKHHAWSFDFKNVAWAVMPMGGDWIYVAGYLAGGEFGARLLNYGMLLIICALMFLTLRRWTQPGPALLLISAFASAPSTFTVTGAMFVDNTLTGMLLGSVLSLWLFAAERDEKYLFAFGVMTGSAVAIKLGALPLSVVLAIVMLLLAVRYRTRWAAGVSLVALLVTGAYQYVYAWSATGNPVFPFPNQWFQSPDDLPFPFALVFNQKLTFTTLYDLTFSTSKYLEAADGGFGIAYLLLFPLGLIATLAGAPAAARVCYAAGAFMFLTVFAAQPYIRYVLPTFPMLIIPCAAYFARGSTITWWMQLPLAAILTCAVLLNVYLIPKANWYHSHFGFSPFEYTDKVERYLSEAAPGRLLLRHVKLLAPDEPIMFLGGTISANDSVSLSRGWHHHQVSKRLSTAGDPATIAEIIRSYGVRFIVCPPIGIIRQQIIKDFVTAYTEPVYTVSDWTLAKLKIPARDEKPLSFSGQEMLSNGDFRRGSEGWQMNGKPEYFEQTHEMRVSGKDTLVRRIPVEPDARYEYVMRASCEGKHNQLRLQMNWHDKEGVFIGTQLEPWPCGESYSDYKTVMRPPANAASGVLIVAGHTEQYVRVDSVSLKR